MRNQSIIRVVILGALAIIGMIAIQAYLLVNTWNEKEQEFGEKVVIALQKVAEQFEKMGSTPPAYDLINQVTSNYYVVDINDDINANNLEFFLRKELEKVGLREDFEYGIYNCDTRDIAYVKYISYSEGVAEEGGPPVEVELPVPADESLLYYFGVRFPNRTSQILSSMRLTLIFSAILLVTIFFFVYSMFIILRQKRLSEMQKDFINNMTHEFKTPISTIKISVDTFLKSPEIMKNQRLSRYANIISEQNNRLNNQVEKVLNLARIEQDNFKLNVESVNLHELLLNVVSSARLQVEKQGGSLNTDFHDGRSTVRADKLHLTNIVHNLLDNAVKYCKAAPVVTVCTEEAMGGKIRLSVKDCGIGISKEDLNKLFDKFYRVPTGNVHDVKGFGLGLFYAKNICNAHGWKISVESEPGAGTTVSILM